MLEDAFLVYLETTKHFRIADLLFLFYFPVNVRVGRPLKLL